MHLSRLPFGRTLEWIKVEIFLVPYGRTVKRADGKLVSKIVLR